VSRDFVHLHVHSVYSRDSIIRIPDMCERVSALRMPAVAITDRGGLMSAVEFSDAAEKAGIKPIIGCEVLVSTRSLPGLEGYPPDEECHHLILLAENDEGYRNLMRLVSVPRRGEFPGNPIVDKALLRLYGRGLIATSACGKGEIPFLLNTATEKAAEHALEEYREIFDGGRLYLEIQDNGVSGQRLLTRKFIRLARRTGTPLVATNDCHYLDRKDSRELEILQCLRSGVTISEWEGAADPTPRNFVRAPWEMEKVFGHVSPEALENTLAIAERCNVTLKPVEVTYPRYECPGEISTDEYLRELARNGLSARLREMSSRGEKIAPGERMIYRKRLEHELRAIRKCGACTYFLVAWDYVKFAREEGIPVGPGRGSAPGSLVAYVLRLTDIDPIRFNLSFNRFLNSKRNQVPDIDFDVCRDRREEVVRYLTNKYGSANVAGVSIFGTMKGKAVIRTVGRILELPNADVEAVAEMIPNGISETVSMAMENEPMLRTMAGDTPDMGELITRAEALEGAIVRMGRHSAAVVITDGPVSEIVPVFDTKDGLVTQFPMKDLEGFGIVKHNVLGLRILTVINEAVELIRKKSGIEVNLENIPLDDSPTFEMLVRGEVSGVFQCEYQGFLDMIRKLNPENFTRLVDVHALYRPGPLRAGMVDDYFGRRNRRPGRRSSIRGMPHEIEEILRDTYGVILYQEQVIDLAARLAGFSMGKADLFRAAVCRDDSYMHRMRFVEGGVRKGHPRKKMENLFDKIDKEGRYSFCKAHAVGYTLIMYRTAFLKCHWPDEYSAAVEKFGSRNGISG